MSCLDGFAADLLAGGFPCSFEFDVKKNPSPFEVLVGVISLCSGLEALEVVCGPSR